MPDTKATLALRLTRWAIDECELMLRGPALVDDDLREQTQRAFDLLHDAADSLEFVTINEERNP